MIKNCKNCGREFYKKYIISHRANEYCCHRCWVEYRRENPKKFIEKGVGYIRLGSDMREHRVIMERYLGRKLERSEHVHHINKNKQDNRLENLQLISASDHSKIHSKEKRHPYIWKDGKVHSIIWACSICGKERRMLMSHIIWRYGKNRLLYCQLKYKCAECKYS